MLKSGTIWLQARAVLDCRCGAPESCAAKCPNAQARKPVKFSLRIVLAIVYIFVNCVYIYVFCTHRSMYLPLCVCVCVEKLVLVYFVPILLAAVIATAFPANKSECSTINALKQQHIPA